MKATTHYPRISYANLLNQVLAALALGFFLFFAVGGALVFGYQMLHAGAIYAGVRIAGIDVGGLTPAAATAKMTEAFQYPLNGRIVFQDGSQTWVAAPGELGLFLDPQTTIQRAYQVGRAGSFLRRLSDQMETRTSGYEVAPAFLFDERAAYRYLSSLAAGINRPVIEASLTLQGTQVVVRSGEIGRQMDVDATLTRLSSLMRSLQDGVVPLVITETPPVVLDPGKGAEQARAILSKPLKLTLPEGQTDKKGPWVIEPETLAGLLSIQRGSGDQSGFQVGVNNSLLRTYLGNLVPAVDIYPQNARFIFNDDTRKLEVIEKSVTGRTLDVEATLQQVQKSLAAGQHTVPLVFQFVKPAVEDTATGESLGITELVEAQTSWFYGSSASRVQNIQAAAARFHGLLIAPGETFSMSNALGDISLDNGYAEAMIILGGRTIKGVGGGVCQVSTTLFRTAFFAGFPVIERHAHAYRVYYYEKVGGNRIDPSLAGLDATVFVPLVDFKFQNDTPNWLLMETYVNPESSSITWKFYSTKDGRSVDWNTTGPVNIKPAPDPEYKENPDLANGEIKQVDWQAEGADVTVNRSVLKDGNVYFQDSFITHYEPWADVYEYGPGTELPTPEPKE